MWGAWRAWRVRRRSPRAPLEGHVGSAGGPALDVEDRPDLLGPLGHVQEPEPAGLLSVGRCLVGDPGTGIVDRERDPARGRAVAHDDRRPAMLDSVRERLLGDPEDREL